MAYFKCSRTTAEDESGGGYVVPSFAQGTDSEITEALNKHRAGEIDLTQYWSVGDEREIGIHEIASSGIGSSRIDSYPGQVKKFVILHGPNAFELSNDEGGGYNTFVIGMKNILMTNLVYGTNQYGCRINGTADNTGGWKEMPRRAWCDNMFKPALPTEVQKWFKKFKYKASDGGGLDTSSVIENYFTLPSVSEIYGPSYNTNYAPASEDGIQMDYYKIDANKNKRDYDSGNTKHYWLRSAYKANTTAFCLSYYSSSPSYYNADSYNGLFLAPFGVV